jgi:hypothetical protein
MTQRLIVNILSQLLRNLPGASQVSHQIAVLKDTRKLICYNQSKLSNYIFLSSRRHKNLKIALANYKQSPSSDDAANELRDAFSQLSNYLENDFRDISEWHFEYLVGMLKKKSVTPKSPRACIKGFQEDTIITLAGDPSGYYNKKFPLNANTAFSEILSSKSYYLCNDIPHSVKMSAYRNARIVGEDVAKNYSSNPLKDLKLWLTKTPDKNWQRCWERIYIDGNCRLPPIESCYKSTLVIPMSFGSRGWLSDEFQRHFVGNSDPTDYVSCFGFLCIDHQNAGYFRDEDIDMSYVFADLLSLYLIQKLTCSAYSSVWQEASEIVDSIWPQG